MLSLCLALAVLPCEMDRTAALLNLECCHLGIWDKSPILCTSYLYLCASVCCKMQRRLTDRLVARLYLSTFLSRAAYLLDAADVSQANVTFWAQYVTDERAPASPTRRTGIAPNCNKCQGGKFKDVYSGKMVRGKALTWCGVWRSAERWCTLAFRTGFVHEESSYRYGEVMDFCRQKGMFWLLRQGAVNGTFFCIQQTWQKFFLLI